MGSASPLLRFRVYRAGDTHIYLLRHVQAVCDCVCVCVLIETTFVWTSSIHTKTEPENSYVYGKYTALVFVTTNTYMHLHACKHLCRSCKGRATLRPQTSNMTNKLTASKHPEYRIREFQPTAQSGGWGANLPRTGPSVLLLPRPPACVPLLCCV